MASGVGRASGRETSPGFLVLIGHVVTRGPQACHRQLTRQMESGLWRTRSTWPHVLNVRAALPRGFHDRTAARGRQASHRGVTPRCVTAGAGRALTGTPRSGEMLGAAHARLTWCETRSRFSPDPLARPCVRRAPISLRNLTRVCSRQRPLCECAAAAETRTLGRRTSSTAYAC